MTQTIGVSGILFSGEGLEDVMRPYLADIMIHLWKTGEEMSSHEAMSWHHGFVKKHGGDPMSRASYINGLNALVNNGVLSYTETTGKGGHRRIYRAAKNPDAFMLWLEHQTMISIECIRGELENAQLF